MITKDDIQRILTESLNNEYGVDISGLPGDTPITKIRELSPKLDSLEFLQFLFSIEDKTGIDLPEGTIPTTLQDILDGFYNASISKNT
jgi:acyl carrier protein